MYTLLFQEDDMEFILIACAHFLALLSPGPDFSLFYRLLFVCLCAMLFPSAQG